ncbi:hypothetical protein ACP70R_037072 [Stipagrostis hirtigluma subsp. patula]
MVLALAALSPLELQTNRLSVVPSPIRGAEAKFQNVVNQLL